MVSTQTSEDSAFILEIQSSNDIGIYTDIQRKKVAFYRIHALICIVTEEKKQEERADGN